MQEDKTRYEKQRVQDFFSALDFRFKTLSELDLYLANRFNVFRYIRNDENAITQLVRDLLDPGGVHGQRDAFLKSFLGMIQKPQSESECRRVIANCEERTTYSEAPLRRIDLTIAFGERFGIGIENKPWAVEQKGWVKDYSGHLSRRFKDFVLIYLTPDGRVPEDAADRVQAKRLSEQGRFMPLSYRINFLSWLENCYRDCRAERVRTFLRDFIEYVRVMEEDGSVASQNELSIIVDYLLKNPASLDLAHSVKVSWTEVVRKVAETSMDALEERLGTDLPNWERRRTQPNVLVKSTDIQILKSQWAGRHAICLCAEKPECADFGIGVWKDETVPSIPGLNERMAEKTGHAVAREKYWEWWTRIDNAYRYWNNPETMARLLAKDEALKYFADYFIRIKEVAEPLIDEYYGAIHPSVSSSEIGTSSKRSE